MPPRPIRRFTIADGMTLIAALALGSMLGRACMAGVWRMLGLLARSGGGPPGAVDALRMWTRGPIGCLVVPLMAATIALRLRRPRPRRVVRQPGFLLCVAAMASLVPGLAWWLTIRHRPGFQWPNSFDQTWYIVTQWTTPAVVGACVALLLCRRWRAEPSWVDRLGRVLGLYWVLLFAEEVVRTWVEKLLSIAGS